MFLVTQITIKILNFKIMSNNCPKNASMRNCGMPRPLVFDPIIVKKDLTVLKYL